jgi:hypothetical protein
MPDVEMAEGTESVLLKRFFALEAADVGVGGALVYPLPQANTETLTTCSEVELTSVPLSDPGPDFVGESEVLLLELGSLMFSGVDVEGDG